MSDLFITYGTFFVNLLIEGFWLGALIGAVTGAVAWTVADKGTHGIMYIAIGFVLGLMAGLYMEGGVLISFMSQNRDAIFNSPEMLRARVFAVVVSLVEWIFGFMAIGAAVAGLGRAVSGLGLGAMSGTVTGAFFIILNNQAGFNLGDSLMSLSIGIISMVLLAVVGLGGETKSV